MKINRPSSAMATARTKGSRHDIDPRLSRRSAPCRGVAAIRRPGGRYRGQLRIFPAQDREDGRAAVGDVPHAGTARPELRLGHLWRRRSEERRVGTEFGITCRFRWSPNHYKKKIKTQ